MLKIIYAQILLLFALPISIALLLEEVSFFNEFIYFPLIVASLASLQILKYNHIVLIRIKYFFPMGLIGFYAINVILLRTDVIIGFIALFVTMLQIPLYQREKQNLLEDSTDEKRL